MYNDKKILTLIPARGGSERLPNKNIKIFDDKPMIAHCISKALAMSEVDSVVVSTDSPKIAEVATHFGAQVPFLRDAALAQKDTPFVLVVKDAIERLQAYKLYDYILLLQANSPLTEIEDMQAVVHKVVDKDLDVVFTVTQASHPPQWSLRVKDGRPSFAFWQDDDRKLDRSQDQEVLYRSTGAAMTFNIAYFLQNMDTLRLCFGARNQRTEVVITDPLSAVDIDTKLDYLLATTILSDRSRTTL